MKIKKSIKHIYSLIPLKNVFCRVLKDIKFPIGDFYKYLYFKGWFRVQFEKYEFNIYHYGNTIENELFWKGIDESWEAATLKIWIRLCKISETIFDIGANTGIYGVTAKAINPHAKVYSFEPSINTYHKLLKNNLINNFDIVTEQIALSNKSGIHTFYDTFSEHQYSASLSPDKLKKFKYYTGTINEYLVKTETLAEYITRKRIKKIDLMKIDVELHEPEVIEGMADFLWKYKPTIIMEILTTEVALKINQIFEQSDYRIYHFNENKILDRVEKTFAMNKFYNFLFITDKVSEKLGLH